MQYWFVHFKTIIIVIVWDESWEVFMTFNDGREFKDPKRSNAKAIRFEGERKNIIKLDCFMNQISWSNASKNHITMIDIQRKTVTCDNKVSSKV